MVNYCAAYNCKNKEAACSGITFHKFPTDPVRRRLWEMQLKRKDFTATKYSRICSKHFEPECFDRAKLGGTWLKKNALPTIFDFPEYLQPKDREKKQPPFTINVASALDESTSSQSDADDGYGSQTPKRCHYLGDFTEADVMASPAKAAQVLRIAVIQKDSYTKQIKNLKQKNKRMKKNIECLTKMVIELKNQSSVTASACGDTETEFKILP